RIKHKHTGNLISLSIVQHSQTPLCWLQSCFLFIVRVGHRTAVLLDRLLIPPFREHGNVSDGLESCLGVLDRGRDRVFEEGEDGKWVKTGGEGEHGGGGGSG